MRAWELCYSDLLYHRAMQIARDLDVALATIESPVGRITQCDYAGGPLRKVSINHSALHHNCYLCGYQLDINP